MLFIYYPISFISSLLLFSYLSSHFICSIYSKHMYDINIYYPTYFSYFYFITNYTIIYNITLIYHIPYSNLYTIPKLTLYITFIELFYYIYHRLVHISYFYKKIHYYHHINIIIYPLDFIKTDYVDNLFTLLSIHLPLYIIKINYFEYIFIFYLYLLGGFLIHSNLFSNIHIYHHNYFKYNFCLLIPIWDLVFNTYLL